MEFIYIIIGIGSLAFLGFGIQKWNELKSLFFRIKKKLDDDLLHAEFQGDWRSRQETKLKLLWLEVVKEVESKDFLGKKKQEPINTLLVKLAEFEVKFPAIWKLDDLRIPLFAERIVQDYGKLLAQNKYAGPYKPDNVLPYPKTFIKKAIMYTLDYAGYEKAVYKTQDKAWLNDNLRTIYNALDRFFVNTENQDLPTDPIGNMDKGQFFYDKQSAKGDDSFFEWRAT